MSKGKVSISNGSEPRKKSYISPTFTQLDTQTAKARLTATGDPRDNPAKLKMLSRIQDELAKRKGRDS